MSMTAEFRAPETSRKSEELGYPLDTPIAEMTDAERAEYWRHEAKKQQSRLRSALSLIRQSIDEAAHI